MPPNQEMGAAYFADAGGQVWRRELDHVDENFGTIFWKLTRVEYGEHARVSYISLESVARVESV